MHLIAYHHLAPALLLTAAALNPKFTSFPALSPLLREGGHQNLHAGTPCPLGHCIWPATSWVVQFLSTHFSQQLPAFMYKLSPTKDEAQSAL